MKKQHFYILLFSLTLFASCTKVIDVNLNEADPKIVIEAQLIEGTNDFVTKITKTGNFFGEGSPTAISGATVTLFDGTTSTTGTDLGNGEYKIPGYTATPNTAYTLTVNVNGETFVASSIMPQPVVLDTLEYEFESASAFSQEGYTTYLVFQDPVNQTNYYRSTIKKTQGVLTFPLKGIDDLYLFNDEFINGNLIKIPVFNEVFELGDSLTVDLYSMNKKNFLFYTTLSQIANGGGSNAAPANPENNWNNNALGNFSTVCIRTATGIVQ